MNRKKLCKRMAFLAVGGSLLIGGSCVPDNFLANTFASALGQVTDVVVDDFLIQPVLNLVITDDDT